MRKLTSSRSSLPTVRALLLGSALGLAAACTPEPVDMATGAKSGGSSGSAGGSGGTSTPSGSGGSTSTGSGGSTTPSGSGGTSSTGSGGTSSSGSGGRGGSSSSGSGGTTSTGSGGTSGKPDSGTTTPDTGGGGDAPTFASIYTGIITPNCLPCHNADHKGFLFKDKATAYTTIKAMSAKLVTAITPVGGKAPMPKMKPALATADIDKIKAWIAAGTMDN